MTLHHDFSLNEPAAIACAWTPTPPMKWIWIAAKPSIADIMARSHTAPWHPSRSNLPPKVPLLLLSRLDARHLPRFHRWGSSHQLHFRGSTGTQCPPPSIMVSWPSSRLHQFIGHPVLSVPYGSPFPMPAFITFRPFTILRCLRSVCFLRSVPAVHWWEIRSQRRLVIQGVGKVINWKAS